MPEYYPWGGEFHTGNPDSSIAVATLAKKMKLPEDKVAIHGPVKTENLGVEKVVANIISNPHIRHLIVFGEEVKGHRSGHSLVSLWKNGFDDNGRIIGAKGAVPYVENLDLEAVRRFQEQVTVHDMIGKTDEEELMAAVTELYERNDPSFGDPYIAIKAERVSTVSLSDKAALHETILIDPYLEVKKMDRSE